MLGSRGNCRSFVGSGTKTVRGSIRRDQLFQTLSDSANRSRRKPLVYSSRILAATSLWQEVSAANAAFAADAAPCARLCTWPHSRPNAATKSSAPSPIDSSAPANGSRLSYLPACESCLPSSTPWSADARLGLHTRPCHTSWAFYHLSHRTLDFQHRRSQDPHSRARTGERGDKVDVKPAPPTARVVHARSCSFVRGCRPS